MNTRQLFAWILSGLVLAITVLALLGIWEVIPWEYVQKYFWKSIQSLIILVLCAVVIYLIQSLFPQKEESQRTT